MNTRGFTIIELIVIIAVIAVLAGVVIVGYGSWRNNIQATQLESDLIGVATAMENTRNMSDGYPGAIPSTFITSDGILLTLVESTPTTYCIEGTSTSNTSLKYYINHLSARGAPLPGDCASAPSGPAGSPGTVLAGVISTTVSHTCAISQDSNAYCWGTNYSGELGRGTTSASGIPNNPAPVLSTGLLSGKTIKNINVEGDTFSASSCAVASDDRAYCWGHGGHGKLGNGSTSHSSSPVAVSVSGVLNGKTVKDIKVGRNHVCALASDDKVYCWGTQQYGQLGNGVVSASNTAVPVAVLTSGALSGKSVKSISVGAYHTCAVATDNAIHCWGINTNGSIGDGTTSGNVSSPATVTSSGVLSSKTINSISSGGEHSCIVASDSKAYCWGKNNAGQLGNNSTSNANIPVAVNDSGVLSGLGIKAVSAGTNHSCVIASNNRAYCWGFNNYGQLGDNTSSNSSVPVAVVASGSLSGKNLVSISAGSESTCAVASDRTSYCWGRGSFGNLGTGNTTSSLVPVPTVMP